MTTRNWFNRFLSAAGFLLAATTTAWASPCQSTTLDVYTASGFTCTLGTLQFNDFSWASNAIGNGFDTVNLPTAIAVTPQSGAGGTGFNFSNLGAGFDGTLSNVTSDVFFDVTALSGTITGASVALGAHTGVAPDGTSYAYFEDLTDTVNLAVADPLPYLAASPAGTSASETFAGITSATLFSGGAAVVTGFSGGSATTDAYTVLLSTTGSTAVPEPASFLLVGLSGAVLLALRRRA